jgi:hypothetical protein
MDELRLTRDMVARSRVIASGPDIREVDRLVASYGGSRQGWVKKSTPILVDEDGSYEVHWYYCREVGNKELKRKDID